MGSFFHLYNTAVPFLEILTLAFIIYLLLYYLRRTRAVFVLAGMFLLLVCTSLLFRILRFDTLSNLLSDFTILLPVAIVVIFQAEIRKAFARLGASLFIFKGQQKETIQELVQACCVLASDKIGALIVIEGKIQLQSIIDEAIQLDNPVQAIVLESIFFPKSPLHDGAVVIRDGRIIAARAILPLSNEVAVSKRWGTRHRAALGITDETDAIALVVSEETGLISVASQSYLWRNIPEDKLYDVLNLLLIEKGSEYDVNKILEKI